MSITLHNPIFWTDIPDVDVLRHGNNFYMVSTTMHVLRDADHEIDRPGKLGNPVLYL